MSLDYPKFLSLTGWILVIGGGLAAVAALAGAVFVLWSASTQDVRTVDTDLHHVHYVIRPHWTGAVPFLLALMLSGAVVILGFTQTRKFVASFVVNGVPVPEEPSPNAGDDVEPSDDSRTPPPPKP